MSEKEEKERWLERERRICGELFTEKEREYLKFGLHMFLYNMLKKTQEVSGKEMEESLEEFTKSMFNINNILERCDLEKWILPKELFESEE